MCGAVCIALALCGCTSGEALQPPAPIGNADTAATQQSLAAETSPPESAMMAPAPLASTAGVPALSQVAPAPASMPVGATVPATTTTLGTPPATLEAQAQGIRTAAIPVLARLQLAPVVGPTPDEIAPLTQRLMQRAAERGLSVATQPDPAATHVVKGYLSSLPESGGHTVVYVWDVFDRSGTRVHRIQGREGALGQDSSSAMRAIADRTVDELASWIAAQRG